MFLVALTYGFTHVFSGRGAFTQIGALIGTIMVANVFVIIIPNQKKIVAALIAGKEPNPALGEEGKQRSVHNNYLTLPVVFLMITNHYPLLFATRYNWLIVAIVLAIGPVIRHFYNSRHEGKGSPWWTWGVAAAGMIAVAWLSALGPRERRTGALPAKVDVAGRRTTWCSSRCSMCHTNEPVWPGVHDGAQGHPARQPGDASRRHARLIDINAVRSRRHAARQHDRDDAARSGRCSPPGSRPARRRSDDADDPPDYPRDLSATAAIRPIRAGRAARASRCSSSSTTRKAASATSCMATRPRKRSCRTCSAQCRGRASGT